MEQVAVFGSAERYDLAVALVAGAKSADRAKRWLEQSATECGNPEVQKFLRELAQRIRHMEDQTDVE